MRSHYFLANHKRRAKHRNKDFILAIYVAEKAIHQLSDRLLSNYTSHREECTSQQVVDEIVDVAKLIRQGSVSDSEDTEEILEKAFATLMENETKRECSDVVNCNLLRKKLARIAKKLQQMQAIVVRLLRKDIAARKNIKIDWSVQGCV
jgi:lantibiotic modifying enzyme